MKHEDEVIMKAIALCYKPYLKTFEAMLYTGLGRTQLSKRCAEFGIFKTSTGNYKREELDRMSAGSENKIKEAAKKIVNRSKKAS